MAAVVPGNPQVPASFAGGPSGAALRYLAWLYASPEQQGLLRALYGLESEIRASLRPGLDHHVAHVRLEWWRGETERCARGDKAVHPLTLALIGACGAQAGPPDPTGLVDVTTWDLAGATFESRRELVNYCERWASAMIRPALECTSPADTESAQRARALGVALREIEMLIDLADDAQSGRLRVPLDELDQIGIAPESLATPPWSPALASWLRNRHAVLREELAAGVAAIDRARQPVLRGLLVWCALAVRASRRAESALPGTLRLTRVDALANGWVAWRVAHRATAKRFSLS